MKIDPTSNAAVPLFVMVIDFDSDVLTVMEVKVSEVGDTEILGVGTVAAPTARGLKSNGDSRMGKWMNRKLNVL